MPSTGALIRNIPLSPAVTGALLYALTRAPPQYRQPLLQKLSQYLSSKAIARAVTTLKWLLALGLIRNIHLFLSDIAQNNFHVRSDRHRYDWPREIVVVTGAASGFGRLMALGFAQKGVNVMAVDIVNELPSDMQRVNKISYYKCDLRNRDEVMELQRKISHEHGDPSVLINNAGVMYEHSILDASERTVNNMYNVNVISNYWTLQAFMPAMIKKDKGHIVTIASMASFIQLPGMVPYCNTKAAVLSLHEGLKQEMRVTHNAPSIKFTSVHPTFANTPLLEPCAAEVRATKSFVLEPHVVADAVVQQVLSCKGKQIILGGPTSWLSGLRAWPHYLGQGLLQSMDRRIPKIVEVGTEKGKKGE